MIIYFAGAGDLNKESIKRLHKIVPRRLLSFFYLKVEPIQLRIFKLMKTKK